jgi:hypothetical protein
MVRIVTSGSPLWDPTWRLDAATRQPQRPGAYPFTLLHLFMEPWTYYMICVVAHLAFRHRQPAGSALRARRWLIRRGRGVDRFRAAALPRGHAHHSGAA